MAEKMHGSTREKQRVDIGEPPKYDVIFHNDDFTPMEFVVFLLENIFFKSNDEANRLMLKVHQSDKAAVGTYTYDIAVSKKEKAVAISRENSFPLRITVEPHKD